MGTAFISTRVSDSAACDWPEVLLCFNYWRARCGKRFAPAWRDLDLMTLPLDMAPYLTVVDRAGDSFRYRYWGSGHAPFYPHDYTDCAVDDVSPTETARTLKNEYKEVAHQRAPLIFEKLFSGGVCMSLSLRMPLSGDGKNVDGVISYSARREIADAIRTAGGSPIKA